MHYAQMTFLFIQSPSDPSDYIVKVMWLETSEKTSDLVPNPIDIERAMGVLLIAVATGKLVL